MTVSSPVPASPPRPEPAAATGMTAQRPAQAGSPSRDADGRFAVLGSAEHFRGKIFSVRVDDVLMPGGNVARRDVVDHLPAVAVVAVDDDGDVVLIEQFRHPLRRRLWEIPAGLMDVAGEPPLACAQRELVEEVGLAADRWSVLVDLASSPGFSTEGVRVFLATGLRPVPAPPATDEEADLRVVRVPLAVAVDAALRGDVVSASAVAGLLAAAHVMAGGIATDALRAAETTWADSPAAVNEAALQNAGAIGSAPELGTTGDRAAAARREDR